MSKVELGSAEALPGGAAGAGVSVEVPEGRAVPLSDLQRGQRGRITSLDAEAQFLGRLQDLGFVPGSLVTVRQKAPLQDPVEYEIRGSRFCLRRVDAQHIIVAPVE